MEEIKQETVASNEAQANKNGNENQGTRNNNRRGQRRGKPGQRRGGRRNFRRPRNEFKDRVVDINRVSKTEKGGKTMRFDALVVIGDGKGRYGFGLRKSGEVPDAIKKALSAARKNTYTAEITDNGSIRHEVIGKFGATEVMLKPAPAGTGIVAGGAVRAVLELAGYRNIVSKVYGSRTAVNVIRATDDALRQLKKTDEVLVLRGLKTEEEVKAARKANASKNRQGKRTSRPAKNGGNK